jgi:hypothetical protein
MTGCSEYSSRTDFLLGCCYSHAAITPGCPRPAPNYPTSSRKIKGQVHFWKIKGQVHFAWGEWFH